MPIEARAVCHIAIVVRDIESTVANWAQAFCMEKPEIFQIPPSDKVPAYTDGTLLDHTDCKIAVIHFENLVLEFVQPGDGPSPWKSRLETHGEGFHNMSFVVPECADAFKTLASLGAPEPYHIGYYPDGTYAFIKTERQLGIELNIKDNANNREKIACLLKNCATEKERA